MAIRTRLTIALTILAVLCLRSDGFATTLKKSVVSDPAKVPPDTVVSVDEVREQVRKTEMAFAKSMADRDHAAFMTFLAHEAIFVGPRRTLRGREAVADGWKSYFEGSKAPFAWKPETVEVLDSGTLALSSGPVLDPEGKRIGTFVSTWRREGNRTWKIVLDIGCPDCESNGDEASPKKADTKKK